MIHEYCKVIYEYNNKMHSYDSSFYVEEQMFKICINAWRRGKSDGIGTSNKASG